jgi:ubiquitin-activating enzyme E1
MRVLLVGCRGTGIEVAKNLALQGAGAITLCDAEVTQTKDLGSNFFLFAEDVQKGVERASACAPRLKELNPICEIKVADTLTDELITSHSAVVITQFKSLDELTRINELCRSNGVSFLYTFTGGVSSTIFVDHGPNHSVHDPDGERPLQKLIVDVTPLEEECLVRYETPEGQIPVGIDGGNYEVTEVEGVDGINDQLYPVTHSWKDPVKTIRVPKNIQGLPKYVTGGLLTQKKLPKAHPMESFANKVRNPGFPGDGLVMTDLLGFTELQQHAAFVAVSKFAAANNRLPALYSDEDAAAVLSAAKDFLADAGLEIDLDEAIITRTALLSSVELQPMCAFIGGVLAQEVVKITGKFTPIPGFMHFSCPDALPEKLLSAGADTAPKNHRNDELAAVYGWPFVQKLGDLNYFMVGCGALGCEFMKNFALNGIFCGPNGKLVVTDADRIELSNLSRQFLFREHNVGQPKSRAAGAMATVMNADFKVDALEHFVGGKSEDIFTDKFWSGLDGVCNALDNMEARLYVDGACVKYEKSLLESGTMGTSGNVDTIAPFKTRTYAEGGNAAEGGGVPMCTLRNFPHLTDHCIEWARDQFELLFVKLGKSGQNYLEDSTAFEEKVRDMSKSEPGVAFFDCRCLTSMLRAAKSPTIGAAAQLAFDLFHYLFRDRILDLQSAFPRDARMTDENKNDIGPFWSEKKRYPTVVVFNPDDDSHTDFMISCTCLFASLLGLVAPKKEGDDKWCQEFRSRDWVVGVCESLSPPEYIQAPVSGAGLTGPEENNEAEMNAIVDRLFADLRAEASGLALPNLEPADFEKDDDYNFHISFIASAANLRCDNYSIKRTDFQACKIIAGKIIAAIATTTAAVCGLVILELFKLVLDHPTDKLMNRQIGLATNAFTSFTQEEPKKFKSVTEKIVPAATDVPADAFDEAGKIKDEYCTEETRLAYPEEHTVWDKMTVDGSMTLADFSKWLEAEHKLKMQSWDFIYGRKNVETEGKKSESPVTAPVFPPKPVLDYSLVPALDLSKAQATQSLMRNPKAKPLQQYIALWSECQKSGMIPSGPDDTSDAITGETTLREILHKMAALAKQAKENRAIDNMAITALEGRQFWLIPSSDTPMLVHAESFDDVTMMVSIKITL